MLKLFLKQSTKLKPKSKILIIAVSDSSGGAGIQADIKTVTSLGSYAMTAITAVTVQNTKGVKSDIPISADEIRNQIIYTSRDIKPDAIKIGMLHSSKVVEKVIDSLNKIKVKKIILDPVMIAKDGSKLIDKEATLILESVGKNTAPAIAVAANHKICSENAILVLPSDHEIKDSKTFQQVILNGLTEAKNGRI